MAIFCKFRTRTGWRSTKTLDLMAYSCTCTLQRMLMDLIWSFLLRRQRTPQESRAQPSTNTCGCLRSTAIWSGIMPTATTSTQSRSRSTRGLIQIIMKHASTSACRVRETNVRTANSQLTNRSQRKLTRPTDDIPRPQSEQKCPPRNIVIDNI